jgi:hypothetical protein
MSETIVRRRGRPPRMPFAVLLVSLLGGGLCALLALNTATAASEVSQRKLDAANSKLGNQEQQLSRDVADLQAPSVLGAKARAMGLIPAGSPAFLRLNADGTVTVMGSPGPAEPATVPTRAPTAPPASSAPASSAPASSAPASSAPASSAPASSAPTTIPTTVVPTTVTISGGPR